MPASACAPEADTLDRLERQLRRMAFDLHDGLMQSVAAARIQADLVATLAGTSEGLVAARDLTSTLDAALAELHEITTVLRPPALDATGLDQMLRQHVASWGAVSGVATDLAIDESLPPMSSSAQIAVFRIVQEALNNAAEHGEATHAEVRVGRADGSIACEVTDNGRGFDPCEVVRHGHHGMGLCGMRERAELLGGDVVVSSAPGAGTSVVVRIPLWS